MNILIDKFPSALEVDGKDYEINTDYRYALSSILAFEDDELTTYEKVSIMLQNIFGENIPENVEGAILKCQWFLNCGIEGDENDSSKRRIYSFSKDANFIFAAFSATHGIDLQSTKMHWWRFYSSFMDLGQNTTFCNLTALRKRYYDGKCTKEEKQAIHEIWDIFDIPDNTFYSLEEKELMAKVRSNYDKAKGK